MSDSEVQDTFFALLDKSLQIIRISRVNVEAAVRGLRDEGVSWSVIARKFESSEDTVVRTFATPSELEEWERQFLAVSRWCEREDSDRRDWPSAAS